MKKIIALMLTMVLVLGAVSAFAAGSKTNADVAQTKVVENPDAGIISIIYPATDDTDATSALKATFADALAAGDVLSALPDEVKAQIPEGLTSINEIVTYLLDNVPATLNTVTLNYVFETKYGEAGDKVTIVYLTDSDKIVVEGTIQADGSINVTLTKDQYSKIEGKKVTMIVISK